MFRATQLIAESLQHEGINFDINEGEKQSAVVVRLSSANIPHFRIKFFTDDDNDVAIRCFGLVRVPENKRASFCATVNALNNKYPYLKFVLDDDGDVNIEYDMPLSTKDPGALAKEMIVHIYIIANEAYPELMRILGA